MSIGPDQFSLAPLYTYTQEDIASYLERHPSTSQRANPLVEYNRIIQAVAEFFANETNRMSVNGHRLYCKLVNLNINIPDTDLRNFRQALSLALRDYLHNKPIVRR